ARGPPCTAGALSAFASPNTAITSSPAAFGVTNSVTVSGISSTKSVSSLVAGGSPQAVASLVTTTTLATVTTSANHGYATGNKVTIAGSSIAGTNGTFSITKTRHKTYTYLEAAIAGT